MKKLLTEKISKEDMIKYIKKYYSYAKKYLKLDKKPKLKFISNDKNADDFLGKTGYYDPKNMTIHLFITDRHPKDIVRSFAHELIHHYQNLNEKLPDEIMSKTSEIDYASKDSHLRDMEREAFEKGNMMFRDWTDSLKKKRLQENKNMEKPKLDTKKSDLNKDGKLSPYEKKRGTAIAKAMKKGKKVEEAEKLMSKTEERKVEEQIGLENTDPKYKKFFEQETRVMDEHKSKREEIIYNELMRRFLPQGK